MARRVTLVAGGGTLVPHVANAIRARGDTLQVIDLVGRPPIVADSLLRESLSDATKLLAGIRAFGPSHLVLAGGVHITDTDRRGLAEAFGLAGRLATGFRQPSLYQRFSPFGKDSLKAERTVAYEISGAWRPGAWSVSVTPFEQNYRDLIDFDLGASRFANVARARIRGVESEVGWSNARWSWRAAHTYLDAGSLARRPAHASPQPASALSGRSASWASSCSPPARCCATRGAFAAKPSCARWSWWGSMRSASSG